MHEVLKLRYFADKLHMELHGFLASGDSYSAMEFGPVASETYNLMKAARGDRSNWIADAYPDLVRGAFTIEENEFVRPLRGEDASLLSQSDIECLENAIAAYGNLPFDARTTLSHDDAWKKAWTTAKDHRRKAESMPPKEIAGTLRNAEEVIAFISA